MVFFVAIQWIFLPYRWPNSRHIVTSNSHFDHYFTRSKWWNWVLSTVLTQSWVEDEVRGRVFSMDMLILGTSAALSTTTAGYLVEYHDLSLKTGFISFSIVMIISGIIFALWRPDNQPHTFREYKPEESNTVCRS